MRSLLATLLVLLSLIALALASPPRAADAQGSGPGYRNAFRYRTAVRPVAETIAAALARRKAHGPRPAPSPQSLPAVNRPMPAWLAAGMKAADAQLGRTLPQASPKASAHATSSPGPALPSPPADEDFDTIGFTGFIPPDDALATNQNFMVSSGNADIGFFNLNGTLLDQTSLVDFFPDDTTGFIFDPRCVYDQQSGRFIFASVGLDPVKSVSTCQVAISAGPDPRGTWFKYEFDVTRGTGSTAQWNDYPSLGYDGQAIYVSFNNFGFNEPDPDLAGRAAPNALAGPGVNQMIVLDKSLALTGQPITPVVIQDILLPAPNQQFAAFTVKPLEVQDGVGSGMAVSTNDYFALAVYQITDPLGKKGAPAVAASSVGLPVPASDPNTGRQPDNFPDFDTGDIRLQQSTMRGNVIWTCQTTGQSGIELARPGVRFYRLKGAGTSWSLVDENEINDPNIDYYYPAIVPDLLGNAIAVFQGSGPGTFNSIYHARFNSETKAFDPVTLTKAGNSAYVEFDSIGRNRWGDYCDASLDLASNGREVWIQGEYPVDDLSWQMNAARVASSFITVATPKDDALFLLGQTVQITWSSGSAPNGVEIALSRDGGQTYPEVIAADAPDTGSFNWAAALPFSYQCKVRVSAVGFSGNSATSPGLFTVTDGFQTGPVCTAAAPIPIPDNFRSDSDWIESSLIFPADQIVRGIQVHVNITHPFIGDLQVVLYPPDLPDLPLDQLTPAQFQEVVILHNQTGGAKKNLVATYPIDTLPFDSLHSLRERRSKFFDPLTGKEQPWRLWVRDLIVGDVGQLNQWCLTIFGPATGKIHVTAPNGGETWPIGTQQTVTWTSQNVPGDVSIDLSRDGGQNWENLGTAHASPGSFNWLVTGPPTTQARVRVTALDQAQAVDASDADFTILQPTLDVIQPNGGEKVSVGLPYPIKWKDIPTGNTVRIDLSKDSGSTWSPLIASTPDDGEFDWTPTADQDTTHARIRITANDGLPRSGQSAADFTIQTPTITVSAPAAGAVWYTFTTHNILWSSVGVTAPVKIELFRNGAWETLTSSTPNTGSYAYTVSGAPATVAEVRITDTTNPIATGTSGAFTIKPMVVQVTAPNGGEVWGIGTKRTFTWTEDGVPGNVEVDLSRDGGNTWETIGTAAATAGTLSWTVSGTPSSQCLARVQAVGFPPSDVSDSAFSIITPTVKVIAPNGGEQLLVGQPTTLQWSSQGLTGNVKIELSRNGGGTYSTLSASQPANGSLKWTVTGPDTQQALLRVTSLEVPSSSDTSDRDFTIVTPLIQVTSPAGGETWFVGSQHDVTWTSQGLNGNVKVELSRNGKPRELLAGSVPATSGKFTWTVTGPDAAGCVIFVTSLDIPTVSGQSGAFAVVTPTITLGNPNGGVTWLVGTTQNITWSSNGVTGTVNIDLSVNGGANWSNLFSNLPNTGSQAWTVTGSPTNQARIRVSWTQRPEIFGQSAANFIIAAPQLTVTAPAAGAKWPIGSVQTISWTGTVLQAGGTVDVQLARNGTSFATIISGTLNSGSVQWSVTGPTTGKAKIRVIWNGASGVQGDSGTFSITPKKKKKR